MVNYEKYIMVLLVVCNVSVCRYVSGMQLRSVDLTNFIYITDASMKCIGHITTYVIVFCLSVVYTVFCC